MSCRHLVHLAIFLSTAYGNASHAEVMVKTDHVAANQATGAFEMPEIPRPVKNDVGEKTRWVLVDGQADANGGGLEKLSDGSLPFLDDQPRENFFFAAGGQGGRLLLDLENSVPIEQFNSYSWHPAERGPQVYSLYASDGNDAGFKQKPAKGVDPTSCGWTRVAKVDTRPNTGSIGGQYGVSISDSNGLIGTYRYLLLDVDNSTPESRFGQTFFSEIDVQTSDSTATLAEPVSIAGVKTYEIDGGKYQVLVNTSETPDLTPWADRELVPVMQQWYPKIVESLASEGYEAPGRFYVYFGANMEGVAAASGTSVGCSGNWFRRNLQGEAKGAVVHELVHVVQQYKQPRRGDGEIKRTPGWVVEGIADYIRWYQYEPQSLDKAQTARRLVGRGYDESYRTSANFLDWVAREYSPQVITRLNAMAREGQYSESFWEKETKLTLPQLGEKWQASLKSQDANATE